MVIDDFKYMNRMGPDHKAVTRFLQNAKIEPGGRMVKLPSREVTISTRSIQGGGTLSLTNDSIFFKDPNHSDLTTSSNVLTIWNDKLYYFNGTAWVLVTWRGSTSADFDKVRYWSDRGTLHVPGGPDGVAAVYEYLDRQIADSNGYFNDAVEFEGFWFGAEELPTFPKISMAVTAIDAVHDSGNYSDALQKEKPHYIMAVYNCDGQESIPSSSSMIQFGDGSPTESFVARILIAQSATIADHRVTAIDLYVATDLLVADDNADVATDTDFHMIQWKFLRRIHINKPHILWSGTLKSISALDSNFWNLDATQGTKDHFTNDVLNTGFKIRFRPLSGGSWDSRDITDVVYDASGVNDLLAIAADGAAVAIGQYDCQVISEWTLNGAQYDIYTLWRFEGSGSSVSELGDPIDTVQAYSLIDENFPQAEFVATQDRRTFRLGPKTDIERPNTLLWSEVDKPQVVPNGNLVLLNINPGEAAKGLVAIRNGLLALYEQTAHYIRMTGEPVEYDAEEGRSENGCIASKSVVEVDERLYWLGPDGVKMFDGSIQTLSDPIRDDYISLIASELAVAGTYEGIVGGYSRDKRMIVWVFPSSTLSIEGNTINALGYDVVMNGFVFLNLAGNFTFLFQDYDGVLYGSRVSSGVDKIFGDTPSTGNAMVWRSGSIMNELDRINVEKFRVRYLGTFTIEVYPEKNGNTVLDDTMTERTSVGTSDARIGIDVNDFDMKIYSSTSKDDAEMTRVEIKLKDMPR